MPARALNMIAFVDREWSGEIANRLRGVGRYHASRLVVLSYEPAPRAPGRARHRRLRRRPRGRASWLCCARRWWWSSGDRHLDDLYTIADPLVVSDLPTLLWSPHGHHEIMDELLGLAQAVLLDSVDEPVWREAVERARALSEPRLRGGPRLAALHPVAGAHRHRLRPPALRRELRADQTLTVRHHPDSTIAALLLVGWLASRLGWDVPPAARRTTTRSRGDGRTPPPGRRAAPAGGTRAAVRGLAGLDPARRPAAGALRLDRGPGGLHAFRSDPGGVERDWTILGASRGEAGILGEGIRQALLRDPTYVPALAAAGADGAVTRLPHLRRPRGRGRPRGGRDRACAAARLWSAAGSRTSRSPGAPPPAGLRSARRSARGLERGRAVVRRRALRGARGPGEQPPARSQTLLAHLPGPAQPLEHRIQGELGPEAAARAYEAQLRAGCPRRGRWPARARRRSARPRRGRAHRLAFPGFPEVDDDPARSASPCATRPSRRLSG